MNITRDIAIKVRNTVDIGLVSGLGKQVPGEMCVEAAVCYALGLPHGDDPGCVAPALRNLKIRLNDSRWSSNKARANGLRRLAVIQLGSVGLDEQEFVRRVVEYTIRTTIPRAIRVAASIIKIPEHKAAMIAAAVQCERNGDKVSTLKAKKTTSAAYAAGYAAAAAAANAAAYAAAYAAADDADAANAAAYAAAAASDAAYGAANAAAAAAAANAAANAAAAAANAANAAANAAADDKRDTELSLFAEAVVQILIEMQVPGCQWLDLVEVEK